jgi:hypothetical protein
VDQQRPHDPRHFVGQCRCGHLVGLWGHDLGCPLVRYLLAAAHKAQDGVSSDHQETADITISFLGNVAMGGLSRCGPHQRPRYGTSMPGRRHSTPPGHALQLAFARRIAPLYQSPKTPIAESEKCPPTCYAGVS